MRKNLVILRGAILLCAGATAAIVTNTARADAPMGLIPVAMVMPAIPFDTAAPTTPPEGAPPGPNRRGPNRPTPSAAQMAAMRGRMCNNRYAHAVGQMAEFEVQLNLTPAQTTAFATWRDQQLAIAKRQASECAARPDPSQARMQNGAQGNGPNRPTPPGPVEQMARQETMLQAQLADVQAERPLLETLYNALTPTQRQIFDQSHPRPQAVRGRMGMRRFGPIGMRGRMGGGPMGRGMPGGPPQGRPNGPRPQQQP
jgi:hypothetical protein